MSFSVQACRSRPRVERQQPQHRVRAAAQPAAPALPRHAGATSLRFNRGPRALARARRRGRTAPSRSATSSTASAFDTTFREWYFLPMIGCIWSCPTDQMLRFPVGTHDPLLPQPRADPGRRPAAVAHRARRRAALRRTRCCSGIADARLNTPVRAHRAPAAGQRPARRRGRHRRAASERFDDVVLACHSDQSLALLDEATRRGARRARRHPLPAQPRRAAHRHLAAAAAPPGLGGLELRACGRHRTRAGGRVPALPASIACSRCPGNTPVFVSLNPTRPAHRPGAGPRQLRLQPPGLRPRRHPRAAPPARDPGSLAPVVLRRLDALWLPRRRPEVGPGRGRGAARAAGAAARPGGRMTAGAHQRRSPCRCGIGTVRHRGCGPARMPSPTRPTSCCCRCARCAPRRPPPCARNRFGLPELPRPRPRRRPRRRAGLARRPAAAEGITTPTARSGCRPTRACWATSSSR